MISGLVGNKGTTKMHGFDLGQPLTCLHYFGANHDTVADFSDAMSMPPYRIGASLGT